VPSYWEYTLEVEGEKRAFKGPYLKDELTRRAVSFIHQHSEEPFFLFLAHYAPHRPLGAPSELINRYQEAGLDLDTATVYAMIEQMDGGIGRILKALEDLGIRDETIMLFTSDNGPDPLIQERFNAGLRGSKYDVFEGGIRVPFILNWPGQLDVGERAEVIHFVDLLPTLAAFCDITPGMTKELDGRNMAPFIRSGEAPESVDHFWQWNRSAPNYTHNAALRRGNWKLVRPPMTRREPEGNSSLEPALYNLAADPAERINLIGEHQELARALLERLEEVARAVERERESVAADYSGHP
jgi:arylsulfatase A-like enzyme